MPPKGVGFKDPLSGTLNSFVDHLEPHLLRIRQGAIASLLGKMDAVISPDPVDAAPHQKPKTFHGVYFVLRFLDLALLKLALDRPNRSPRPRDFLISHLRRY